MIQTTQQQIIRDGKCKQIDRLVSEAIEIFQTFPDEITSKIPTLYFSYKPRSNRLGAYYLESHQLEINMAQFIKVDANFKQILNREEMISVMAHELGHARYYLIWSEEKRAAWRIAVQRTSPITEYTRRVRNNAASKKAKTLKKYPHMRDCQDQIPSLVRAAGRFASEQWAEWCAIQSGAKMANTVFWPAVGKLTPIAERF